MMVKMGIHAVHVANVNNCRLFYHSKCSGWQFSAINEHTMLICISWKCHKRIFSGYLSCYVCTEFNPIDSSVFLWLVKNAERLLRSVVFWYTWHPGLRLSVCRGILRQTHPLINITERAAHVSCTKMIAKYEFGEWCERIWGAQVRRFIEVVARKSVIALNDNFVSELADHERVIKREAIWRPWLVNFGQNTR